MQLQRVPQNASFHLHFEKVEKRCQTRIAVGRLPVVIVAGTASWLLGPVILR